MVNTRFRYGSRISCAFAFVGLLSLANSATFDKDEQPATSRTRRADVEHLARNIYYEARGESFEGQVAVGWVTINRVDDPRWPDTIPGVVYQPWQFSWTHEGHDGTMPNRKARASALQAAQCILDKVCGDPTGGATHYHADYVTPYWSSSYTLTIVIGRHLFYR